jgi:MFS transporter, YNFM family, putative membrane transport protein
MAVVLAGGCAFLDLYATQPLLPLLATYFHASKVGASLTVMVCTLGVALAAPLTGTIADRLGRKRVIVPATFLLAVPTLLAATSMSLGQLLFWRFLQGIFTPGIFAVTVAYIHDEWAEGGTGTAMAAYVTGTVIGGFCGRTLAGFAGAHLGWREAFVALGVLNLAGAVAIRAWLPAGRKIKLRTTSNPGPVLLRHLRNPQILATCAVGFCVLFTLVGLFTYINFRLAAPPFHLGPDALGLVFVTYLVGAVATPPAGRAIDRFGARRSLAAAMAVAVLGALLTLPDSLLAVIAGLAVCCTAVFISQSAASSYVGQAAGEAKASAVGLYVTSYYCGGTVGAVLPGLLWAHGGWPACVALVVAVQMLTAAIALVWWKA